MKPNQGWIVRAGSIFFSLWLRWIGLFFALSTLRCAHSYLASEPVSSITVPLQGQIVTPNADYSEKELFEKGRAALVAQDWKTARDAFSLLLVANSSLVPRSFILFNLAVSEEGLDLKERARNDYQQFVNSYADDPQFIFALTRLIELHALFEDWTALQKTSDRLLAKVKDSSREEQLVGLAGRALSLVELGDDNGAMRLVLQGLDMAEQARYGMDGKLPVPLAMLRFAMAEVRRTRSERIQFVPIGADFLSKIDMRAQGLLDAQNTYSDVIRCVDPYWAALSGYRIGQMYRTLHADLMAIPPTGQSKTEEQKKIFYAMMHMRYRVLLEKGIEMMRRTLALLEKLGDSLWVERVKVAKEEMEHGLEEEKKIMAEFPFTEQEVERALEMMKERKTGNSAPKDKKR
ncbi:tetratricopeptide repeat protein [Pajaroellobacter abortibovis]|nr:hypothetical protein [Pajaroellobacter abortibovis]